jgi:hypothetical protein
MLDIEENLKEIENDYTRSSLKEVIYNIKAENYRSAIVVLYTTLLYDILKQLENLRDYYDNNVARDILIDVFRKKSADPTSPRWESELLTELKKRNFISHTEVEDLKSIQTLRNYGAHPIIEDDDSKVEVSIRPIKRFEILDAQEKANRIIFSRQLGLGQSYITEIINYALETINNAPKSFEQHFSDKYLKKLKKTTYRNLFRVFFKALIFSDDEDAIENRQNLVIILKTMFYFNSEYCTEFFRENNFEMLSIIPNDIKRKNLEQIEKSKIHSLITFLKYCPKLFDILPDEKKNIIINSCKDMYLDKDPIKNNISSVRSDQRRLFKEKGRFISSTLFYFDDKEEYFNILKEIRNNVSRYNNGHTVFDYVDYLDREDFKLMIFQCEYFDMMVDLKEFVKDYISDCCTYDGATRNIKILTNLNFQFSEEDLKDILAKLNVNNQYYEGRDWEENFRKFCENYDIHNIETKLEQYSNLIKKK